LFFSENTSSTNTWFYSNWQYVKQVLGHKRIENTMKYVQLAEELFKIKNLIHLKDFQIPWRSIHT